MRPDAGSTVTIKGMAPRRQLTAGVPLSFTEWRVPASRSERPGHSARPTLFFFPPPALNFFLVVFFSCPRRAQPLGAAQVTFMQLFGKLAAPTAVAGDPQVLCRPIPPCRRAATNATATANSHSNNRAASSHNSRGDCAPCRPWPAASTARGGADSTTPARAAARRRSVAMSPNEIASMSGRAQESAGERRHQGGTAVVAACDAAKARDARAALALAKTFYPYRVAATNSGRSGTDRGPRANWVSRAREWGARRPRVT